jgi:chloramphenicol 3-O phosphotransferase
VTGSLIVLNGTSSAGKTTLARALQRQLAAAGRCWIILGIDDFLGKLPAPWLRYFEVGSQADDGLSFETVGGEVVFRAGPVGRALLSAYRRAVGVSAQSGMDVIVDEVVVDDESWDEWSSVLRGLDAMWVRVDCPPEVCEERARARGDRLPGLARSQARTVHRHPRYDLAVDTSTAPPDLLARAVLDAHVVRGGRS